MMDMLGWTMRTRCLWSIAVHTTTAEAMPLLSNAGFTCCNSVKINAKKPQTYYPCTQTFAQYETVIVQMDFQGVTLSD